MPVRRRTDTGRWIIDFRVAGKRYRETLDESHDHLGKREVEGLARSRRQAIEAQGVGAADTWGAVANRFWLEHAQYLKWAPTVTGHLDQLSDAIGDQTPVGKITTDTFAAAVARWRLTLAPRTVNLRIALARTLWGVAGEVWGLDMPKIAWRRLRLAVPDREPPYLAPAVRAAIAARAPAHVALAIALASATAWRRSSVLGLCWQHVDWDRELIHGRGKGVGGGKALVAPLTSELRQILLEAAGPAGPPAAGLVVTYRGRPVISIDKGFRAAAAAAGYPRALFRDLRHSAAQEILAATGSLDLTGAALAHTSPALTRKHYARVKIDAIRAAFEARSVAIGAPERALKHA